MVKLHDIFYSYIIYLLYKKYMPKTKLTSVNILESVYNDFKKNIIGTDLTLQKIVNRSLDLYNNNQDVKNLIDNHETQNIKNSKF